MISAGENVITSRDLIDHVPDRADQRGARDCVDTFGIDRDAHARDCTPDRKDPAAVYKMPTRDSPGPSPDVIDQVPDLIASEENLDRS